MKNTNCPLVKIQLTSSRAGQRDEQSGGLRIAMIASIIAGAFVVGSLTSQSLTLNTTEAERLQSQIQSLKSETQVTASKKAATSKFVADI